MYLEEKDELTEDGVVEVSSVEFVVWPAVTVFDSIGVKGSKLVVLVKKLVKLVVFVK